MRGKMISAKKKEEKKSENIIKLATNVCVLDIMCVYLSENDIKYH